MSREYPDYEILEIVCAGPKQYALKLRHKTTNEIDFVMRCRGVRVDKHNEGKLSYEMFKEMVLNAYNAKDVATDYPIFEYNRIGPNKASQMFTQKMSKVYRCVNTKGYNNEGVIYPFGFE
jgi:Zn-finger nucleic acid-binding protein